MSESQETATGPAAGAQARLGWLVGGRYPLQRVIGLGGMAAVYASVDPQGRPVAIKMLHDELIRSPSARERFTREVKLTRAIDHPGRVTIYDEGLHENCPYQVMELLDGLPLDRLWKQHERRLPVVYALQVAREVLGVLAVGHSAGIVHRDLKPANMFVTSKGEVKVLDFGVARQLGSTSEATLDGTALGTPAYMAPEQAMGTRDAMDGRADLFSVGALLYSLISGKKIHNARSEGEAFVLAATRPVTSVAKVATDLPPEVVALIDRALQWDRRNRYPDADAMREEIDRVLSLLQQGDIRRASPDRAHQSEILAALVDEGASDAEPLGFSPEVLSAVKEIFILMERTLGAVRQYGLDHPMPARQLSTLHGGLSELLESYPEGLVWELRPHSFVHGGQVVWEPLHPYDQIPYNLFANGLRRFAVRPGLSRSELGSWLDVIRRDPTRDFAPEDDFATALWECQLQSIEYEVAASFFGVKDIGPEMESEDDVLEQLLGQVRVEAESGELEAGPRPGEPERLGLEARAVALAARATALEAARSEGALSLSSDQRRTLAGALEHELEDSDERFGEALALGALDALAADRLDLLTEPLSEALCEAQSPRRLEQLTGLLDDVLNGVEAQEGVDARLGVEARLLDASGISALLTGLARPAVQEEDRRALECVAARTARLLEHCGPDYLESVLEIVVAQDREIHTQLLGYLSRQASGAEETIGERLKVAPLESGQALLQLLEELGSAEGLRAMRHVEENPAVELRVAALGARAGADSAGLREELTRLSEHSDAKVRTAVLTVIAQHQLKEAGPLLVQQIQDSAFHRRPLDERQLALVSLHSLSPGRAEQTARDLAERAGSMLGGDAAVDTRVAAIEFLAERAESPAALEMLDMVKDKWSNGDRVRAAADRAAGTLRSRFERSRHGADRGRRPR